MTAFRRILEDLDVPDPDSWQQLLEDWFGFNSIPDEVRLGSAPFYRVLYLPSFDPDCCITVREGSDSAEVSLATFGTNLRTWALARWISPGVLPRDQRPRSPEFCEETGRLDRWEFDRLRDLVPPAVPSRPIDENRFRLDGITVHWLFRHPDGEIRTSESWRTDEPAAFQFARAVHGLAWEVLTGSTSIRTLRGIRQYFA